MAPTIYSWLFPNEENRHISAIPNNTFFDKKTESRTPNTGVKKQNKKKIQIIL